MTAVMTDSGPVEHEDGSERAERRSHQYPGKAIPMSHRAGLPIVVAMFVIVLAAVASSSSAQTIMRKPNEGRPSTLEPSPGQVPREGSDPDGPYSLTVRVYVMPFDPNRLPVPGKGAHLLLTDATGRRLGRDPTTSVLHDEIPDGRYEPVINP